MRSYKMVGLGCVLVLAGCANNTDLASPGAPFTTPKPDAGAANNSGGSQGVGMTSGASSGGATDDDDGGTMAGTSGGSASGGSESAGASTGPTADAGTTRPPAPSGVIISEVMARPSSGSDNEWIEIFNAGDKSLELQGCALATGVDAKGETVIDATLSIAPGAYVLFGRDGVQTESGVKPDYVYAGLYLSPDETVTLSCNGQIVSQVSYMGAESESSLQLDARYAKSGKTGLQSAWCNGSDALPLSTNLGTPKAANRDCPGAPAP